MVTSRVIRAAGACAVVAIMWGGSLYGQDVSAPGDPVVGSSTNHPAGEVPAMAIDNRVRTTKYLNFDELNTGFTVTPASGASVVRGLSLYSADNAPERDPASYTLEGSNDGVTFTPISSGAVPAFAQRFQIQEFGFDNSTPYTTYRVLFPTVQNAGAANSMQIAEVELLRALDVTLPSNTVTGSSTNHPAGEVPAMAIDNRPDTKYLNFDELNAGLTVNTVGEATIVNAISLISADNSPERDPASYTLEGSNDGTTFTLISSGPVAPFADRGEIRDIAFPNADAYTTYRLLFPTVQNPTNANSMQIAEIQLLGSVIPEPASLGLLALGGLGLLPRRRRA